MLSRKEIMLCQLLMNILHGFSIRLRCFSRHYLDAPVAAGLLSRVPGNAPFCPARLGFASLRSVLRHHYESGSTAGDEVNSYPYDRDVPGCLRDKGTYRA